VGASVATVQFFGSAVARYESRRKSVDWDSFPACLPMAVSLYCRGASFHANENWLIFP
jgi:hypothetical protein